MPSLHRFFILLVTYILLLFVNTNAQTGLRAEYFNDTELTNHVLTRIERQPYFDYYLQPPAPGVSSEYFSVRWTGKITAPLSGKYTFFVETDDGMRLWIDNKKLIDVWWDQEASHHSASIDLEQGKQYDIKIEYYNGPLHSVFMLQWEQPDDSGYEFMGYRFLKTKTEVPSKVYSVNSDTVKVARRTKTTVRPSNAEESKTSPGANVVKKTKQRVPAKRMETDTVIAINESIELRSVEFEQTKYDLQEVAHKELNALAQYLKKHPGLTIKIIGHTDYAGDSTANLILSQQRANAVAGYLKAQGVNSKRVTVLAMGSTQPKVVQGQPEERRRNRRVEFVLAEE